MDREKSIPSGYMTVGQAAKKLGVTVRTLQYYDKEGILSPSLLSEGGRRLYTDKDILKIHQILSLKSLGFSLSDIKDRLSPLDSPEQVAEALSEQISSLRTKVDEIQETLRELEALRAEVLEMRTVDFKRYADIIVNLQMKNDYYWLLKHFDDNTMEHIRSRFDKDSGKAFIDSFMELQREAVGLIEAGVGPGSPEGIDFAKKFWDLILQFTGGDMSILSQLVETGSFPDAPEDWRKTQERANEFIGPALEAYFASTGTDPFTGGQNG